jgi:hypothetical protein
MDFSTFSEKSVTETRARIQGELQGKRDQIEQNTRVQDTAQCLDRQARIPQLTTNAQIRGTNIREGIYVLAQDNEHSLYKERTEQSSSIAAGLASFPLDQVEKTRARIRHESRLEMGAEIEEIEGTTSTQAIGQSSSIAAGLARFPLDQVEQMRARIRHESRLERGTEAEGIEGTSLTQAIGQSSSTAAGLAGFPLDQVEQIRLRIRDESRLETGAEIEGVEGSSSTAGGLASFPLDQVEQMRARIRDESRLERVVDEEVAAENHASSRQKHKNSRQAKSRQRQANSRQGNSRHIQSRQSTSSQKQGNFQPHRNRWTRSKLLEDEQKEITAASEAFPPTITPSILRACTQEYHQIIKTGSRRDSCASCGSLFEEASLRHVAIEEPYISTKLSYLDRCGKQEDVVMLCGGCGASLQKNAVPKFSAINYINTTLCQAYPSEL